MKYLCYWAQALNIEELFRRILQEAKKEPMENNRCLCGGECGKGK